MITLDFETYFDNDYTLRKLTTEGYVRDKRFELLCTGVKIDDKTPLAYLPGTPISLPAIPASAVLCHHAHFDGLILSHQFGLRPAFWFDTLSMARLVFPHAKSHSLEAMALQFGLGSKTVPYELFKGKRGSQLQMDPVLYKSLLDGCCDDLNLTYRLFHKLLPMVPKSELKLIDITVRMFTEPVLKLDRARVEFYMKNLQEKQDKLLNRLGVTKETLHSAQKFADILRTYGLEPPTKKSPRTGKETFAFAKTDQGMQDLVQNDNEEISLLAQARLSTKSTLGETRAQRLLDMSARGNLCIYLKHAGAHTFRWSGGDKLNFQNLPRGGELRKSILAPEGFVLGIIDLSQIECRVLNWLAGQLDILEKFRNKEDLYCFFASSFYGRTITKEDKKERFLGKTAVLGCGYGVGWKKFQLVLKLGGVVLTDQEAKTAVERYRYMHPNVVNLWKAGDYYLGKMKHDETFQANWGPMLIHGKWINLPNGTTLDYTHLSLDPENPREFILDNPKGRVKIYGGKLVENVVQALSRVILSEAMLKIAKIYKIATCTHDELVYIIPEQEAEMGLDVGLKIMRTPPEWCANLPLDAEGAVDVRYSK